MVPVSIDWLGVFGLYAMAEDKKSIPRTGNKGVNMVTIEVENLITHMSFDYKVSRVPCIGENMMIGNDLFEVVQVFHCVDIDPNKKPVAIIRVK